MESKYEQLPVYKSALDMAVYFEQIVRGFDKSNKYSIGADLRSMSREVLVLVAKANIRQTRAEYLQKAIEKLEELKILIRICKELKTFKSFNSYDFSIKSVVGVVKQCEGWLRSQSSSSKIT